MLGTRRLARWQETAMWEVGIGLRATGRIAGKPHNWQGVRKHRRSSAPLLRFGDYSSSRPIVPWTKAMTSSARGAYFFNPACRFSTAAHGFCPPLGSDTTRKRLPSAVESHGRVVCAPGFGQT